MFSLSKPELSETNPIPVMHSTAAITLFIPGFLLYTAHARNGTSTQYVAVRKAFFPAVVYTRPYVCTM